MSYWTPISAISGWWYGATPRPAPARNAYTGIPGLQPALSLSQLQSVTLRPPPPKPEAPPESLCPYHPGSPLAEMWERFRAREWVDRRDRM